MQGTGVLWIISDTPYSQTIYRTPYCTPSRAMIHVITSILIPRKYSTLEWSNANWKVKFSA